jgi:virulence-associated protein VapD
VKNCISESGHTKAKKLACLVVIRMAWVYRCVRACVSYSLIDWSSLLKVVNSAEQYVIRIAGRCIRFSGGT